jgi:L,D-peptidoglycan transpeptidase YkuD (ErfK/YbiS/YcfS/YnhG family)
LIVKLALHRPAGKGIAPNMIVVRRAPLDPRQAIVRCGPLAFRAALGRGGINIRKREGDGVTPRAQMRVLAGFRRGGMLTPDRSGIGLSRAGASDGWCDAPDHGAYNRPVRLPFRASHETLIRDDVLYDFGYVLDWNMVSRRRGAGSAIFLHVAKPGFPPTQGCIALKRRIS